VTVDIDRRTSAIDKSSHRRAQGVNGLFASATGLLELMGSTASASSIAERPRLAASDKRS